jgi:hypothetical protein
MVCLGEVPQVYSSVSWGTVLVWRSLVQCRVGNVGYNVVGVGQSRITSRLGFVQCLAVMVRWGIVMSWCCTVGCGFAIVKFNIVMAE